MTSCNNNKIDTRIRKLESKPFLFFFRDHLRSTLGITCGRGSFAVHFGDHLRSRDHLRLGIICGTVQRGDKTAMSRGIAGGKQVIKFANTSNRGRVCLFSQIETTSLDLHNLQFEIRRVLRYFCWL